MRPRQAGAVQASEPAQLLQLLLELVCHHQHLLAQNCLVLVLALGALQHEACQALATSGLVNACTSGARGGQDCMQVKSSRTSSIDAQSDSLLAFSRCKAGTPIQDVLLAESRALYLLEAAGKSISRE